MFLFQETNTHAFDFFGWSKKSVQKFNGLNNQLNTCLLLLFAGLHSIQIKSAHKKKEGNLSAAL